MSSSNELQDKLDKLGKKKQYNTADNITPTFGEGTVLIGRKLGISPRNSAKLQRSFHEIVLAATGSPEQVMSYYQNYSANVKQYESNTTALYDRYDKKELEKAQDKLKTKEEKKKKSKFQQAENLGNFSVEDNVGTIADYLGL